MGKSEPDPSRNGSDNRASSIRVWIVATRRLMRAVTEHEVVTAAAGIAFFLLLAAFPGLAAVTSVLDLLASAGRADALLSALSGVLPRGAVELLARQINRFAAGAGPELGLHALAPTPYVGFAALIWAANKGTKAFFRAFDRIYGRSEARSFLSFTLVTLACTFGAIAFLVFSVAVILVLPAGLGVIGLAPAQAHTLGVVRWPVLLCVVSLLLATVYRSSAPQAGKPWRVSLVSGFVAALLWVGGSLLFSWYATHAERFAEIYGSLTAVIGLMVWLWISTVAVLFGAELSVAGDGFLSHPQYRGAALVGHAHRREDCRTSVEDTSCSP